jgi:ATP-dependent DNA helicase RecG
MGYIVKHTYKTYIITGNPRREERWDYPMDALREIVINMIVHRDYRSANDSTIKIFDDRIEFFNPGALLDDLTVDMIKKGNYKSHLRNKQIDTVFKELELIEKYGSGVRRVIETFVAYGLPEPVYEATQGGMAVTVFKTFDKPIAKAVSEGVNGGVNGGVSGMLSNIQSHPGQRSSDMVDALNTPLRTIERWLKQLKENGQIEFRGAKNGRLLLFGGRRMSSVMKGAGYGTLLTELKTRIHTAQYAALRAVNKELIALYWDIKRCQNFKDATPLAAFCFRTQKARPDRSIFSLS